MEMDIEAGLDWDGCHYPHFSSQLSPWEESHIELCIFFSSNFEGETFSMISGYFVCFYLCNWAELNIQLNLKFISLKVKTS